MEYTQQQIEYIAINTIDGLGDVSIQGLIEQMGSLSKVLDSTLLDFRDAGVNLPKPIFEKIKSSEILDEAQKLTEKCSSQDIKILTKISPDYPYRLIGLRDAPSVIYCRGECNLNVDRVISIVGTRNSTAYGKKVVEDILEKLSPYSPLIVSGLANGIDSIAHRKALDNGLATVAIFAGGIDKIYPSENISLAKDIIKNGSLVTEYPLGKKVELYQFIARNRIIAGIADTTIVVEAPKKSGALITAQMSHVYGREVFSVPGRMLDKNSQGCLELIKSNKAEMFISAADFITAMQWESKSKEKVAQSQISLEIVLNTTEKNIFDCLNELNEPISYDNIVSKTMMSMEEISNSLFNLEMKGIIQSLPGKKFSLI